MKTILQIIQRNAFNLSLLAGIAFPLLARGVTIPDAGLNAAIREALEKPVGLLTDQDLLSLTNLDAERRNITSLEGLEAALNLVSLNLNANHLGTFSFPSSLTKLRVLNVSLNALTNCFIPNGLTNLSSLILEDNALTNFTLPEDLASLNSVDLDNNQISSFSLPSSLTNLVFLDLGFNRLSEFSLPSGLTNLNTLVLAANLFTNFTLPNGLFELTDLDLSQNQLENFAVPPGTTNLLALGLFFNQLTNLTLPDDLSRLAQLDLDFNRFTTVNFPTNLTRLIDLNLRSNQLTNFNLPLDMRGLVFLDLGENQLSDVALPAGLSQLAFLRLSGNTNLTKLILPPGMTNLTGLFLRFNQLTNLTLPSDLAHLVQIDVLGNRLQSLSLPAGLTNLSSLFLSGNQLASLTLPPDLTNLTALVLDGNPLTTLVLPEPLVATNLAETIATLRNQGVSVFTYPLAIQLVRPIPLIGAFHFGIIGPPGIYSVQGSTNLTDWSEVGMVSNTLGSIAFTDVTSHLSQQKFYRTRLQVPPANMVFIPPNTFTMGSPAIEQDRSIFEGPQSTVTLTHGFWMGKYEVTQVEYLSIMNTNPSNFPGDLTRPVSGVTWFDATNYCWKFTQRELAAARISAGSQYRLPTEAEWECAARAGTSTRFSYGDDPGYASLTNYAWFLDLAHIDLTVHPVGQKLPNPWGFYDLYGNVWEWCQDWYGDQPGGIQTDPTGPVSNPDGIKVMRGGAYDYDNSSCRSASRFFRFASWPDSDVGFRVVLVMEWQ